MAKKTGDRALAAALDFVRLIRKTPIVVNDSRGFYTSRVVTTYIAEGHLMLTEGVPAAMIENAARMAGMPVGPLALNDEVGNDLSLRIMDATRNDLGVEAVPESQYRLIETMVTQARPAWAEERQGLLRLSRRSFRQEAPLAGPRRASSTAYRYRRHRRRRAQAAFPRGDGARDGALRRGEGDHRRARGGRRLDPRLRLPALHRRYALLHRLHGREDLRRPPEPARENSRARGSSRTGSCATSPGPARRSMAGLRRLRPVRATGDKSIRAGPLGFRPKRASRLD